jgi:hypothetical protein
MEAFLCGSADSAIITLRAGTAGLPGQKATVKRKNGACRCLAILTEYRGGSLPTIAPEVALGSYLASDPRPGGSPACSTCPGDGTLLVGLSISGLVREVFREAGQRAAYPLL